MMKNTLASWYDHWIFDSFEMTDRGLALYRIFCALFLLLFTLPSRDLYKFMGNLPSDFYAPPPGPMMLFNGFPSEQLLLVIHFLLIIALISLAIGFMTKWSSLCVGLLMLLLKGFIYSLGKINHDILLVIVPLAMAFSGWGRAYSVDSVRPDPDQKHDGQWTLTLLALIIGFMMFTAGFPKILGGWLNMHTQAAYSHYLKEFYVYHRQDLLAPFGQMIPQAIWEIGDYATILFEVGFLAAILHPKSTRTYVCLAVLFHFSTMVLLNISFLPNFLAYAAFLNWDYVHNVLSRLFSSHNSQSTWNKWVGPVIIAVVITGICALSRYLSTYHFLHSDLRMAGLMVVSLSVPIAVFYLLKQVLKILKRRTAI